MPYKKLKLYPTLMVGIGKGNVYSEILPHCKIYYLNDGNRPYCEYWNHINDVDMER